MTAPVRRALLSAAVIVALGAADAPPDAFGIGVLRRDGEVIPVATFDGRRWRNDWPPPSPSVTVPINLSNVPKKWWGPLGRRDIWQAWIAGTEHDVHVTQPEWVAVHCQQRVALKTDYSADLVPPPENQQPYPKDGLVVSPPHPIENVEILSSADPAARPVASVLRDAFNRAERQTLSRTKYPVDRKSPEDVEPTIEAVHAFGGSPRFYYVEAIRPHGQTGDPGDCSALAFGTGWFVREGSDVRPLLMFVDMLRCDRTGASYMLPLGVVRAQNRLFWIAQFSGWDHERYTIVELNPKAVEVVMNVWGGGC
jgi:hypothetical protein